MLADYLRCLSPSEGERENRRKSFRPSDAGPWFMVRMHTRRRKGATLGSPPPNSLNLERVESAPGLVKEVKRGSSLWLKTKGSDLQDFAWQNGYGIFSIGFSQIEAAQNYIAGQEEHHRKISFQDEFRRLLGCYAMEFDERYLWD